MESKKKPDKPKPSKKGGKKKSPARTKGKNRKN